MSRKIRLSEFVTLKRGYDLPSRERRTGDIPILGSFGITGWHNTAKREGPGVTIGRSGASFGVATFWDGPFWPLNTTLYVTNFLGNDARFVYYVLREIDFRSYNSGSAQPSLNRNYLADIPVPQIPCEQQVRITSILGAMDDLIENNRRRIDLLEQMAQAIYREWFVHFRYPGHEDATLVDSPLGSIPEGCEVVSASAALLINPRLPVDRTVEQPFFTMGDLGEASMICFPSDRRFGGSGAKFENGDTLFARITPCLENGKTGYVQSLRAGEIARGSTEFIVLRGRLARIFRET